MIKRAAIVIGVVLAGSFFSAPAQAQMLGPGYGAGGHSISRPTVSPYLNLVTSDALGQLGVAGGYQTLVKPFVDGRRAINANAGAISRLQSQVAAGGGGGGGRSVGATFMNYSHYYPGMGGAGPAR